MLGLPKDRTHPLSLGSRLRPGAQPIVLRPVQEQALAAIEMHRGLLGAIGVGHGKSYIALLAGTVLDADLSVVLVAPATLPVMQKVLADLEARYYLCKTLVVSWGVLSSPQGYEFLQSLDADKQKVAIIADEAHFARNPAAARTKRLMSWLHANPQVPFVALSGTMTTRRLMDFAHLAERALGDKSPVPRRGPDLRCWDEVLANEARTPADLASVKPLWQWATCTQGKPFSTSGTSLSRDTLALLVQAFGERLRTAPGVVLTQDASCPASLYLVPEVSGGSEIAGLRKRAEEIAQTYRDPDGIELADDAEVVRTAKRLALGYYYRWAWPRGVDHEWLERRQAWSRKCRWLIEEYSQANFDSRALVEAEAARRLDAGSQEGWVQTYARWVEVRDRAKPLQTTTWITDKAIAGIVQRACENSPCLIWYEEEAVANKLEDLGVRVLRAGDAVPDVAQTLALSVRSHGAGLNLQAWSKQVFACVPANGTAWEQVLGRTHRLGQPQDEVWAWIPQWCSPLRSAFAQARRDAAWIETSTGNRQKLMLATVIET